MYRNYIRGQHESLDVDLTDAGSGAIFVKADGLEANAFYDMAIYSDSGRTTPLSVSDWENYTEDTRKTASEAETGGTGETIYNQIRIINPTYQTGTIYLSFENLGTYPNGDVQGIDYIEPGDADYAYTTQIGKMTYIVFDGLTADRTVTVTDGGFDERSRFKIVNKDSTYKVIVKDGTELVPHWIMPGETGEFYDLSDSLIWSNSADELVYTSDTNTAGVAPSSINGGVSNGNTFMIGILASDGWHIQELKIIDITQDNQSAEGNYSALRTSLWDQSANVIINNGGTAWPIRRMWRRHSQK